MSPLELRKMPGAGIDSHGGKQFQHSGEPRDTSKSPLLPPQSTGAVPLIMGTQQGWQQSSGDTGMPAQSVALCPSPYDIHMWQTMPMSCAPLSGAGLAHRGAQQPQGLGSSLLLGLEELSRLPGWVGTEIGLGRRNGIVLGNNRPL